MRRFLMSVRRLVVACTALLLAVCMDTSSSGSEVLFPVLVLENESELFGFMNKQGKYVIEPQFNSVGILSEPWRWEGVSEGLIRVMVEDKWGFIDTKGTFVINPQFEDATAFSQGLAKVKDGDKWGFIDRQGRYVINPKFNDALEFSDGRAAIRVGDKWGFIDKQGSLVSHLQFDDVWDYSDGLAAVRVGDKFGFIDKKGQYVSNPQFDTALSFSDGLAAVRVGDKWGFIGKKGSLVSHLQFDRAENFSEGLAAVRVGDKWGFIDKKGQYVINPQFDRAENFSEGLAAVRVGNKWGFIDKKGQYVINPQFDSNYIGSFSNGLVLLLDNDDIFRYIDGDGNEVWNSSLSDSAGTDSASSSIDNPANSSLDSDRSGAADQAARVIPADVQSPTIGSRSTGPKKRGLPVIGQPRGTYSLACERMVSLILSFPVTTGDIEDGCFCASNAIESAALPQNYRNDIVKTVAGQEYISFAGMRYLASSDFASGEVKLAADEMFDNVWMCLGAIPLIDDAFGLGSRAATPERMVARGTDVRPIPGPARPHFRGVGGLRRMRLATVMQVVYSTFFERQAGQSDNDEYGLNQRDYGLMIESIGEVQVLQCEYVRASRNLISNPYYFWYRTLPTGFKDELVSTLPPQHPIFAVGETREWCPDREPAK